MEEKYNDEGYCIHEFSRGIKAGLTCGIKCTGENQFCPRHKKLINHFVVQCLGNIYKNGQKERCKNFTTSYTERCSMHKLMKRKSKIDSICESSTELYEFALKQMPSQDD